MFKRLNEVPGDTVTVEIEGVSVSAGHVTLRHVADSREPIAETLFAEYLLESNNFDQLLGNGPSPQVVDPDPDALVSPSDGRVSACGRITSGRILQAKGHHYTVRSLLADDPAAGHFANGFFYTIYLSPRDYHRVHMPAAGKLQRMIHVPGRAFSVSPGTVREVPGLFARNERVVSMFDTPHGPLAMVLVGAMLVSSMDTVWAGTVNPPRARRVERTDWSRRDIELDKGAEMGRFNMGSTVIVLLPPAAVASLEEFATGDPVLMGQRLGRLR